MVTDDQLAIIAAALDNIEQTKCDGVFDDLHCWLVYNPDVKTFAIVAVVENIDCGRQLIELKKTPAQLANLCDIENPQNVIKWDINSISKLGGSDDPSPVARRLAMFNDNK